MDAGADDYVVKPFDSHELQARLRAGQRIVELQDELRGLQEEFQRQSRTDPLTGCLNRRAILERLLAELARSGRDGHPLGVAMLDFDHFKRVNDTHGHPAGDMVLCELVRRLAHGIRVSDTFGRVGGEEFLMLWPAADVDGARSAAERVCSFVHSPPFRLESLALTVTTLRSGVVKHTNRTGGGTASRGGELWFDPNRDTMIYLNGCSGATAQEHRKSSPMWKRCLQTSASR